MRHEFDLACGRLRIDTSEEALPLEKLLGFATRRNPKRGFLFVSRVLGKHIPCPPRRMREIYDLLSASLRVTPAPVLVMGMAETATGLGAGVADSLAARRGAVGADVIYQHTTRHRVRAQEMLRFEEAHSHATDHVVYAPSPALARDYHDAATLVLVDDEITTGRTLMGLVTALYAHLPKLERVVFASIVNWLDSSRETEIRQHLRRPVHFVSVARGSFSFEPDPEFCAQLPDRVVAPRPAEVRGDTGRCGILMAATGRGLPAPSTLDRARPVHVVGTGEFAYQPFLLAERLEAQGFDVHYQSSTRSPILAGGAIAGSLTFDDEHGEGVTNYLHNPPSGAQVLVAYETPCDGRKHDLTQQLDATPVFLPEAQRRTSA